MRPAAAAPRGAERIPTLDGWRGVAIAMVVVAHAAGPLLHAGKLPPGWVHAVYLGRYGVALFFGLSGLLICTRLLDELRATGRIGLGGFYLRRGFRILVPAAAYLAAVGILGVLGILPVDPREWWSALLFFRNYVPVFFDGGAGRYTGHFWSLAVEEHFYLLFPLLLAWRGGRRCLPWLLAAAGATAAWRYLDGHHHWGAGWLGLAPYTAEYRTDVRLDGLLWGCVMALLLHDPARRALLARALRPAAWACVAAVYAALVWLAWPGFLWSALLVPPLLAGTVLHPRALPARVLEWEPLRRLGAVSYSLYLWHILFMPQMAEGAPLGVLQAFPLNVACAFAMAAASRRWVELPALRAGERAMARLRERRRPAPRRARMRAAGA
ncbi:MAG: acyltransferase [Longimicrobiaceae bacterium]